MIFNSPRVRVVVASHVRQIKLELRRLLEEKIKKGFVSAGGDGRCFEDKSGYFYASTFQVRECTHVGMYSKAPRTTHFCCILCSLAHSQLRTVTTRTCSRRTPVRSESRCERMLSR